MIARNVRVAVPWKMHPSNPARELDTYLPLLVTWDAWDTRAGFPRVTVDLIADGTRVYDGDATHVSRDREGVLVMPVLRAAWEFRVHRLIHTARWRQP